MADAVVVLESLEEHAERLKDFARMDTAEDYPPPTLP